MGKGSLREIVKQIVIDEVGKEYLEAAGVVRAAEYLAMKYFLSKRLEDHSTKNIRKFLMIMQEKAFVSAEELEA